MKDATHELCFNGDLLARGFWLYVWEVAPHVGTKLYYVGRTGDSSSINAQSPFNRMSQHLGFAKNSNMLRRHLEAHSVQPEHCSFHLVAHGPILEEASTRESHRKRRDMIAALEKGLAEAMQDAGYDVMNRVKCRKSFDEDCFRRIRAAFSAKFPKLGNMEKRNKCHQAKGEKKRALSISLR